MKITHLMGKGLKFGIMYKVMYKIYTDIHIYFDFYSLFRNCVAEDVNS